MQMSRAAQRHALLSNSCMRLCCCLWQCKRTQTRQLLVTPRGLLGYIVDTLTEPDKGLQDCISSSHKVSACGFHISQPLLVEVYQLVPDTFALFGCSLA